ncbi:hypothetical protein F4561_006165 [Lipingzhangella halophila]|uniref:HEAT repeat domain-containing protein n=1 Tax=Lipingzhangella halophila TaxID=1783352 RepID=A0A7W7RNK6_9ACTN|nr:hypothetical protein [Lipingzhangella halophila]MBB4935271.1 hypothetical protein [Lipingzhangella halophila]
MSEPSERWWENALDRLSAARARERAFAADELGDLLAAPSVAQLWKERVAASLVALALRERNEEAAESALNSLARSMERGWLPYPVVQPLTECLHRLSPDLVGYVLLILAGTRDPAARPVIERYSDHPDPTIRADAAEALEELP